MNGELAFKLMKLSIIAIAAAGVLIGAYMLWRDLR